MCALLASLIGVGGTAIIPGIGIAHAETTTTTNGNNYSIPITLNTTGDDKYAIEINWGEMQFEYSPRGSWNPDTLTWSEGTGWKAGDNQITVINRSSKPIEVNYSAVNKLNDDNLKGSVGQDKNSEDSSIEIKSASQEGVTEQDIEYQTFVWIDGKISDSSVK